jgi:hypothetical protein
MIQTPGIVGSWRPAKSASILEDKVLDVYKVLKQKEIAIAQLRREIQALRVVCRMLQNEDDSIPHTIDSPTEQRDTTNVVGPVSERDAILASIRVRLVDAQTNTPKGYRGVVAQFRQAAVGASRALLKRVSYSRLFERKPQQQAIGSLPERVGHPAA